MNEPGESGQTGKRQTGKGQAGDGASWRRSAVEGGPAPADRSRSAPLAASGRRRRVLEIGALAAAGAALVAAGLVIATSLGGYRVVGLAELAEAAAGDGASQPRLEALGRRIAAQAPKGTWASVDTWSNRLLVRRGDEIVREAICSTGSGAVLRHRASEKEWVFDTPIGERRVERKVRDPVWVKPDWAFVEEGQEPPEEVSDRYDHISLGDYGLYLGDGYIIHGTLFRSLLGQKITHGCIRLGDEDLAYLYRSLRVGDSVVLY